MSKLFQPRTRKEFRSRLPWLVATSAASALAGSAVTQLAEVGWRRVTHRDPPRPDNTGTRELLLWTIGVGIFTGSAALLAQQGARRSMQKLTGKKAPA
jgi:hypothetical protein